MDTTTLREALQSAFAGALVVGDVGGITSIFLHGGAFRVTTAIEIGGDVARLFAGRIVHAVPFEDRSDIDHIVELVASIQSGDATGLYSIDDAGARFAGHIITGTGFRYETTDADPSTLVHVPL